MGKACIAARPTTTMTMDRTDAKIGRSMKKWEITGLPSPWCRSACLRRQADRHQGEGRPVISHFFIDRPIFASVLSIVIVVVGLAAMQALPIAQFPEITPPVVQIEADYPGANAEVVADSVARVIELQIPGIDNLLYYDSTSTNDGHMTIRLTFEINTNIDIAQVQAQNREKLAEPQLPPEVIRQGVSVKKLSTDLLAVLVLQSADPKYDAFFLANYATVRLVDDIRRIPGVGDAYIFGQQNYSMRVVLDSVRMAQLSLTPSDIVNVVREQN